MTPSQILKIVRQKGIALKANGESIEYKAPWGFMNSDLYQAIVTQKKELLNILQSSTQNCLGGKCMHASYKHEEDILYLWCNMVSKAVINLQQCPEGKWQKNEKGLPW